jgi:small conductance mechanosensitive channel
MEEITLQKAIDLTLEYLPRLTLALITLIAGLWFIRLLVRFVGKLMEARKVDESLRPFFRTLVTVVMRVLLIISVMGMIGVEMTSFIALLGAVGLSIGMALSGSLQHFAGGVLLLIYKPFKKGDFIEAQQHKGTVCELRIFNTVIKTLDNKVVFIPNGPLSTGTVVNYTTEPTRRIDAVFGISYSDDIDKAKSILEGIIKSHTKIHAEPPPFIGVKELGSSSVNIEIRVWVNTVDVVETGFFLNEAVKKEFDKNGISIPFPQMDVRVQNINTK